jgi:hypothetical protein
MDDKWLAIPKHAVAPYEKEDEIIELSLYPDHPDSGCKSHVTVPRAGFVFHYPDPNRDLCYVIFTKSIMPGTRTKWSVVPRRRTAPHSYSDVYRLVFGLVNGQEMFVKEGPYTSTLDKNTKLKFTTQTPYGQYKATNLEYYIVRDAKGEPGECGFPYYDGSAQKCLIGLHDARYGNDAMVVPIYYDDRYPADEEGAQLQSMPPTLAQHVKLPTAPVKAIPGAKVVGEMMPGLKTSAAPPYSKFFIHNQDMANFLAEDLKVPAKINQRAVMNRLEATINYGQTKVPKVDGSTLTPQWLKGFTKGEQPVLRGFLTTKEALFGFDTAPSMASQSKYVGIFFDKPKKELVDYANNICSDELDERVEQYWKLSETEPIDPVVEQFPKDELLPPDKVEEEICRLVNGHDLAYNVFLRRLVGPVVHWCNTHPARCCAALGINPHSGDWKRMKEAATAFGDEHLLFGDLSKEEVVTAAAMFESFLAWIANMMNLDEIDQARLRNGLSGLHGYYFVSNKVLYMVNRGHSSGHLLTTLYNSFCVWWMHKYVYEKVIVEYQERPFDDYVAIAVHGDDSFGSVSELVRDRYNMVSIASVLKSDFGIKYTCADDKDAMVRPFGALSEATFLGRGFRPVGDKIVGPLRKVAINDCLVYSCTVPSLSDHEVYKMRVEQAFKELFYWGKTQYDKYRKAFVASQAGCRNRISVPTFTAAQSNAFTNWEGNNYPTHSKCDDLLVMRALD